MSTQLTKIFTRALKFLRLLRSAVDKSGEYVNK
jgi:hypothetical protein